MLTSDESAKKLPEELTVIRMHCVFAFRLMLTEIFPISRWAEQHMIKTSSLRQSNGCMTTAFYSAAASYISTPSEVEIMYAMTEQNLEAYLEQYETSNDMYAYMYVDELMQQPSFNWSVLIFTVFSAAAAFLIPQYKKRALEKDAIVDPRRCPLEIAFIIGLV